MTEDNVANLTVEILKGIREDLRTGFDRLGSAIDQTNLRLDRVDQRLGRLEDRFDHVLEFAGEYHREHAAQLRDHERRLAATEEGLAEVRQAIDPQHR